MEELIKLIEEQGFKVFNVRNEPLTILEVYIDEHERIIIVKENSKTFVSLDIYIECPRAVHGNTLEMKEVKLVFSRLGLQDLNLELLVMGEARNAISVKGVLNRDIKDVVKELKNLIEVIRTTVRNFCNEDVNRK